MFEIYPVDKINIDAITNKINLKTKPPGALGELERLASQIALIQHHKKISVNNPICLVFAADHGIASQGVSIAPAEVTAQMVANFVAGGAAINCFCRLNNVRLEVVDAGVLSANNSPKVIDKRIAAATKDFSKFPAMTLQQATLCIESGASVVDEQAVDSDLIAFGEMGIGNTSSAAAIMAALTNEPLSHCVGAGTGVDHAIQQKKIRLIAQALSRFSTNASPITVLSEVGGFEIGQICGAMLRAAELKKIIVVDGFICTAAALLASKIAPAVTDYMIFGHCSEEKGHRIMLEKMNARPLLDLGLRLGEGSGAVLAIPIVQAAVSFYNEMASFSEAAVTDVVS